MDGQKVGKTCSLACKVQILQLLEIVRCHTIFGGLGICGLSVYMTTVIRKG